MTAMGLNGFGGLRYERPLLRSASLKLPVGFRPIFHEIRRSASHHSRIDFRYFPAAAIRRDRSTIR